MTHTSISEAIAEATGSAPAGDQTSIGGGYINEAFRLGDYHRQAQSMIDSLLGRL